MPDRRRDITWIALWLVPLLPSEEAGLVLPHVKRVGKDGLVLDPNDLLVNKNAAVPHRLFDFHLPLRSVPNVDRGVRLADVKCLAQKGFIERAKRFVLRLVGVSALPILILAVGEVLRGVVLGIVGDQVWRVSSA